MHPPAEGRSRPLMQAAPESFAQFDLHLETRRVLWLVALVLAIVFGTLAHVLR